MLTATRLRGLFPAIPTPVKADDTIDTEAVSALFAWLLKQGIDGVVPLGGTGEYGALSRRERIRMAGLSAKAMAGKGPVIAAVSTCLFAFIATLIWLADRLRRKSLAR